MEDSGEQEQLSHSRQDPEQEQNGDPKARTGDRLWEACHVKVSAEEPGQGRGQDGKVNRSRVPPEPISKVKNFPACPRTLYGPWYSWDRGWIEASSQTKTNSVEVKALKTCAVEGAV